MGDEGQGKSGDKQKREVEEKSPWSVKESVSNQSLGRAPGSQSMAPTEASLGVSSRKSLAR